VAVAQEIEQRIHGESLVVQADVSKPDDVDRMVTEAVDKFGKIDILVNNAGLAHPCNFLDVTLEEWNRVIDVNLTGAFICSQMTLPIILQQGWGRIINIASTSGMTGGTSGTPYAAAKGGVIAFTKALSSEFARSGITVNAIVPSKIETDMFYNATDEKEREALLQKIPVGRFGTPEEIAQLALFLASDAAGYITGETIVASGGYR
jgi:3-oxoacyl-[acyl-carrier protein] reductase